MSQYILDYEAAYQVLRSIIVTKATAAGVTNFSDEVILGAPLPAIVFHALVRVSESGLIPGKFYITNLRLPFEIIYGSVGPTYSTADVATLRAAAYGVLQGIEESFRTDPRVGVVNIKEARIVSFGSSCMPGEDNRLYFLLSPVLEVTWRLS